MSPHSTITTHITMISLTPTPTEREGIPSPTHACIRWRDGYGGIKWRDITWCDKQQDKTATSSHSVSSLSDLLVHTAHQVCGAPTIQRAARYTITLHPCGQVGGDGGSPAARSLCFQLAAHLTSSAHTFSQDRRSECTCLALHALASN